MSGFFGVVSKTDCVGKLFYGTDYHSHLGTRRGGLAVANESGFKRVIHDISNTQFRSKFDDDIKNISGKIGIGIISDYENQPLVIKSHLGDYCIVNVGKVNNVEELEKKSLRNKAVFFTEISGDEINQTELIATLINQEDSISSGIINVHENVKGSSSLLILKKDSIYAARDKYGRTPVVIAKNNDGYAVSTESCAFQNLGYEYIRDLGPGEIVQITQDGIKVLKEPNDEMQICTFLWIYYGYPASSYEGLNVEYSRYKTGAALAKRDNVEVDYVCGIPDSGIAHAIGYATKAGIQYRRPFVKYTPTWPRSFMPQIQSMRDLVAKMKLIPIPELTKGHRLLFCEDSIVRGTQLQETIRRIYDFGAKEIHIRPACPPLLFGCKYLNFSRSRSEMDLAGRRAVQELEGKNDINLKEYSNPDSTKYIDMIEKIRERLSVDTLQYQRIDDMIEAIGIPKKKLCTFCWDGCEGPCK
ncbi:amidophosphoribosyltransferase [Bacteroidota bacterium]